MDSLQQAFNKLEFQFATNQLLMSLILLIKLMVANIKVFLKLFFSLKYFKFIITYLKLIFYLNLLIKNLKFELYFIIFINLKNELYYIYLISFFLNLFLMAFSYYYSLFKFQIMIIQNLSILNGQIMKS